MTKLTLKKNDKPADIDDVDLDAIHEDNLLGETEKRHVTHESIHDGILEAMNSLGYTFYETELRRVADNGREYRVDATLPSGVEDTGEIVERNLYRYMQQQIVSVVAWKLEDMLARCTQRVDDQRRQIAQAVRQMQQGKVEQSFVDAKISFLETLIVQQAMLGTAFEASLVGHSDILGEDFETKAMREDRARAISAAPKSALDERLAKLGVRV